MKKFSFNLLARPICLLLVFLCSSEPGAPLRSGVAVADDGVLVRGGTSLRHTSSTSTTSTLDFPRVLKKKNKNKNKNKVPKAAKSKKAKSAVTSQPSGDPCATISTQKDALLALKNGLIGTNTTKLADWDSNTDPCADTWTGIDCDCGNVTSIDVGK